MNEDGEKLQRRPRVEVHTSPSIGGASILSDYPVLEREGDDGPYKLATRRGKGGPISIAWVQEVRDVFRSDAHDLVVVTTDGVCTLRTLRRSPKSQSCRCASAGLTPTYNRTITGL
jgi:hypothetical protein